MKNNYLFQGLLIASSLSLLTACQHFNNSYSKTFHQPIPAQKGTQMIANGQAINTSNSSDEEDEGESLPKATKITEHLNDEKSDFKNIFKTLAGNESQEELRKEFLMSLSKPGENMFKDAADKKERKRNGIRLPGERSGIEEMAEYRRNITMPIGTTKLLYKNGFLEKAYEKAINSPILMQAKAARFKTSRVSAYSLANVVWKERGPNNVPGRGRSLVVSPANPNKWYDGTAGGGVWLTENAGTSWRNTTDFNVPNLATSTIAIAKSDANVIYAGTGEPFNNLDAITGSGVIKSQDGGETWTSLAGTISYGSVGRIVISPTNPNQVLIGTSSGIYKSIDGGTTWAKTSSAGNTQDLKYSADNSSIFAAVNSIGVLKSIDGGATWTQVFSVPTATSGTPPVTSPTVGRVELGISPADNNRVYLSTEITSPSATTGMYMSTDAGATFSALTYGSGDSKEILSNQGWYDNIITGHPTDVNVVYVGGVSVGKITVNPTAKTYNVLSIASGYVTTTLNTYVHPDQHGLVCQTNPSDPTQFRILLNNDGGVWYTDYKTNPGETQNDFKAKAVGLNSTQLYGADKKKGEDSYLSGAQDNGSNATITAPSSATSDYLALIGGDGFEVLWNYNDPQKLLFGSQYNNFVTSLAGVQNAALYYARNSDNGAAKSPFYSKMANANNNPDAVFTVSSSGVWKTPDFGTNWALTAFNSTTNGAWLGNASQATVKVSVANPDVIWAGAAVSGGAGVTYKVNVSKDNGQSFAKTTGSVPINGAYYISGLSASSVNPAQAYTLFSLPGQSKIVKTSDYGATWSDITGYSTSTSTGFPDVPVHSLLEMPFDQNVLWAGTDIGLFETTNGGTSWYLITAIPPVSVWSMKIVDDQVVIATHGRGVWTATVPELSTYVLPHYVTPPTVVNSSQLGIHDMRAKATFTYTDPLITDLKVYVDNSYVSTISATNPNTTYTYTSSASFTEGNHTISASGLYNTGATETPKAIAPVEIINFNAGAANVNLSTIATPDVFIGTAGKFIINMLSGKFTYNVLNNIGHPYAINSNYQTYLRTPIIVGANSSETLTHMAFTEAGYDFAVVEASKDLVNWTTVGSYDESSYADWNNVSTAAGVTAAKFKNSVLDFPSKFTAGDEVAVRLRLTTDTADNRYGWIIKSIVPTSTLATSDVNVKGNEILIAPNPAGESTDLYLPSNLKGNVSVGIYDASGKLVKSIDQVAASKININVSNFQKGVYLILVKTESGNKALKLMKN